MYIKAEKNLLLNLKNVIELVLVSGENGRSICAKCCGVAKPVYVFKDREKKEIDDLFSRLVYATGFIPVNDRLLNSEYITTAYLTEMESGYAVIVSIAGHECDAGFCVATLETEEEALALLNRICGEISTI